MGLVRSALMIAGGVPPLKAIAIGGRGVLGKGAKTLEYIKKYHKKKKEEAKKKEKEDLAEKYMKKILEK